MKFYRTGTKIGRTLYEADPSGERVVGMLDTPELALKCAQALNELERLERHGPAVVSDDRALALEDRVVRLELELRNRATAERVDEVESQIQRVPYGRLEALELRLNQIELSVLELRRTVDLRMPRLVEPKSEASEVQF